LCRKLEPNLAALLKDLCVAGREVQGMLGREPGVELMAVLDVMEPVGEVRFRQNGGVILNPRRFKSSF
jgi:hypothetical protein